MLELGKLGSLLLLIYVVIDSQVVSSNGDSRYRHMPGGPIFKQVTASLLQARTTNLTVLILLVYQGRSPLCPGRMYTYLPCLLPYQ